jgi:hypothetical protein
MAPTARRPPPALRVLAPVIERLGLRVVAVEQTAAPAIGAPSRRGRARRLLERTGWTLRAPYPPDFDRELISIIERSGPYTVTSHERLAAMVSSVEHVVRAGLPGAIVECGVWKGGSMMAAALALRQLGADDRDLYLFDTFEGMPEPGPHDVETGTARAAADQLVEINAWCRVSAEEVRANVLSTGYPESRVHLVEGRVEDTLPREAPAQIAVLRLDTDWYSSTAHELRHLYPRLAAGGILLVDDYGAWSGARKAVDEYFAGQTPFLHRVDYTARLILKR